VGAFRGGILPVVAVEDATRLCATKRNNQRRQEVSYVETASRSIHGGRRGDEFASASIT
jgi:hypothetical protein